MQFVIDLDATSDLRKRHKLHMIYPFYQPSSKFLPVIMGSTTVMPQVAFSTMILWHDFFTMIYRKCVLKKGHQ